MSLLYNLDWKFRESGRCRINDCNSMSKFALNMGNDFMKPIWFDICVDHMESFVSTPSM